MRDLLFQDMTTYPKLFIVFGSIPAPELRDWVQKHKLKVPGDLADFWVATGGCEMFETETVLGPYGDPAIGGDDNFIDINRGHYLSGLDPRYFIFHQGLVLSAVQWADGKYVTLDDDYNETDTYAGFSAWYALLIRSEYAERYGLAL